MDSSNGYLKLAPVGEFLTLKNGPPKVMQCSADNFYYTDSDSNLYSNSIDSLAPKNLDLGKISKFSVYKMCITPDGLWLFISAGNGHLIKYSTQISQISHNFGKILQRSIRSMTISRDSKYVFVCDSKGFLKQFNVEDNSLAKDYSQVHDS